MTNRPLDPPAPSSPLLAQYCSFCNIGLGGNRVADLQAVATSFARLPYENLTKIIRFHEAGTASYRTPQIVLSDHIRYGTGGTCFSLTATLLHLIRSMGVRAEPILADRYYGADTHSALIAWIEEKPHLLDPGYLITTPIPLSPPSVRRFATEYHVGVLTPKGDDKIDLATSRQGQWVHRLTYKLSPADPVEFMAAWNASFEWDMMHYPLLARNTQAEQVYLQKMRLQRRTASQTFADQCAAEQLQNSIVKTFGLDPIIVANALAILRARGDLPNG